MNTRIACAVFLVVRCLSAETIREHPAPGTSLIRFGQLDSAVYKGSKPTTEADFEYLQSKHIKTILNLKWLPFLDAAEKRRARFYGIKYLSGTINASTFEPSEKHVDAILKILHDPCNQPIYVHCAIGRDRTSLISALYLIYFKGLPPENGWPKMKELGFKDSWTLMGLKHYLLKHETLPAKLAEAPHACTSTAQDSPAGF